MASTMMDIVMWMNVVQESSLTFYLLLLGFTCLRRPYHSDPLHQVINVMI